MYGAARVPMESEICSSFKTLWTRCREMFSHKIPYCLGYKVVMPHAKCKPHHNHQIEHVWHILEKQTGSKVWNNRRMGQDFKETTEKLVKLLPRRLEDIIPFQPALLTNNKCLKTTSWARSWFFIKLEDIIPHKRRLNRYWKSHSSSQKII